MTQIALVSFSHWYNNNNNNSTKWKEIKKHHSSNISKGMKTKRRFALTIWMHLFVIFMSNIQYSVKPSRLFLSPKCTSTATRDQTKSNEIKRNQMSTHSVTTSIINVTAKGAHRHTIYMFFLLLFRWKIQNYHARALRLNNIWQ